MGINAVASRLMIACTVGVFGASGCLAAAQTARADTVAYLVNITARPGYNFPDAQTALDYGYRICDHVAQGRDYGLLIDDIKAEFGTDDDYQGAYLINQAANELCPALIWQLRQSAIGYTRSPAVPQQ